MSEAAITVDGVSKSFRIYKRRETTLKATILRGRRGEWEELRVCTNGSPVDMLFIYNENWATNVGEFFVDRIEVNRARAGAVP